MATPKFTPTTLPKRAAVYARQSVTRGEVDESLSIDFQTARGKAWIAANGYQFAGVYTDADTKGWKRHRPQFDRMLGLMQTGQVDVVVVYKLSRFFRGLVEQETLITDIANAGGELVSVTEPWVSASPMVRQILGAVNEDHKRVLSDFLKDTYETRCKRGLHHGYAPLGYRIEDQHLVIDEDRAAVVRQVMDLAEAGTGSTGIATALNEAGIPAPQGGPWETTQVRRMVRNRVYSGHVVFRGEVVTRDAHPAIIEPDRHERIIATLDSRRVTRAKPADASWTDGFVEHACGEPMYLTTWHERAGDAPRYRYRCRRRFARACGHPQATIFPERVEAAFVTALGERLERLLQPAEIVAQLEARQAQPAQERERQRARLDKRIADLTSKRTKLLDMALAGTVDDDLYRDRDATLKADLTALIAERDAIPGAVDADRITVTYAEVANLTEHLRIVAGHAPEELPPLLHRLGTRLIIGEARPRVRFSPELEDFFA